MSDNFKKHYNCETVEIHPNDVILVHLSENVDLDMANDIMKYMKETFPNNTAIAVNEYILQGMTILRPTDDKIVQIEDIMNKPLEELYPDLFTKKIGDYL